MDLQKRPYNHPDNLNQQGKPKASENTWDLMENARTGRQNFDSDSITSWWWSGKTPHTVWEALDSLADRVGKLSDYYSPKDILAWVGAKAWMKSTDALDYLGDKVATLSDRMSRYKPANILDWTGGSDEMSMEKALDALAASTSASKVLVSADETAWQGSKPETVSEAINRMAAVVKALNSNNPIP